MTNSGEITAGKILEAARQLIMRRGYSGFSYADISDAIDIRKASIHHHFPTKTDLAIAVVRQHREMFDTDLLTLQASGADALTQLRAYVGYWERCIADDSAPFCVAGMLGAELPALPDEVAQEVRAYFENFDKWLEEVLASGAKSKQLKLRGTAKSEAKLLVSLIYGAMLAARAYGNAELFKDVANDAIAQLSRP
ncbi:TetR/AcrR family transcriptional regulator [Dyella flava]|uniref:TetR/AcrR family transcriptional regulator n=1 Tax=Dyella flava TaxID=1920170 RepID=A0ABS2K4X7_9GAMM|nr:TetR/AcrR family transcriptional regulator [Dyella flava]MBM7126254.1 TetR/AcrR family transcriptional regulator [Dyella flava]GLQ48941.1 TetR family transcriptional regulator [Dyella flava]